MDNAQEKMEQARPYANRLTEVITTLLPDVDRDLLPMLGVRPIKRVAVVVITSDRGLAGAFNANIIKNAEIEIGKYQADQVDLFCHRRKG